MSEPFSIAAFERNVYRQQYEPAISDLLNMLNQVETNRFSVSRPANEGAGFDLRFVNRLAAAIQALLLDPGLTLSDSGFLRLAAYQRNLVTVFGASGLGGTAHLPALFGVADEGDAGSLPDPQQLRKLFCCCSLDALPEWLIRTFPLLDPALSLPTTLALLSNRLTIGRRAELNRRWLLTHADFLDRGSLPNSPTWIARLSSAWMLCSYCDDPGRHRLKPVLNRVMRRWLADRGIGDTDLPSPRLRPARPTVLVVGEQFMSTHVMFRTFAPFIRQLGSRFRTVLMVVNDRVDDVTKALFDDVLVIERNKQHIPTIVGRIKQLAPDLIYFPSVGMSQWAVALANLRLAPIQFMSLGHPASSFSEQMDYLIMGTALVGNPDHYSERVIVLESAGGQREKRPDQVDVAPVIRERPEILRVAVPSRSIKLTAGFFDLCRTLIERSTRNLELHFFPNEAGMLHQMIRLEIQRLIPGAVVHPRTGFNDYIANLNRCDMALSTFPFTNSNSAVDIYRQGIPMVIFSGDQALELTDERTLRAVGGPPWLISHDRDQYLDNALRLAGDDQLRVALSRELLATEVDELLFTKDRDRYPTAFVDTIYWVFEHHEAIQASDRQCWTVEQRRAAIAT